MPPSSRFRLRPWPRPDRHGLARRPCRSTDALAHLHTPRVTRVEPQPESLLVRLVGRPLASGRLGELIADRWRQDLRIAQLSVEQLIAKAVLVGLAGLLWAPATAALMTAGGVPVSLVVPVWISLVLGPLARSSRWPRCGPGRPPVDEASDTHSAASSTSSRCDSPAAPESRARSTRRPQRPGLGLRRAPPSPRRRHASWASRHGRDSTDSEPSSTSASSTSSPPASPSPATKAHAFDAPSPPRPARSAPMASPMPRRAAQAASERMSLPIVLLMVGFVIFLGYPAVNQVLTGL